MKLFIQKLLYPIAAIVLFMLSIRCDVHTPTTNPLNLPGLPPQLRFVNASPNMPNATLFCHKITTNIVNGSQQLTPFDPVKVSGQNTQPVSFPGTIVVPPPTTPPSYYPPTTGYGHAEITGDIGPCLVTADTITDSFSFSYPPTATATMAVMNYSYQKSFEFASTVITQNDIYTTFILFGTYNNLAGRPHDVLTLNYEDSQIPPNGIVRLRVINLVPDVTGSMDISMRWTLPDNTNSTYPMYSLSYGIVGNSYLSLPVGTINAGDFVVFENNAESSNPIYTLPAAIHSGSFQNQKLYTVLIIGYKDPTIDTSYGPSAGFSTGIRLLILLDNPY